MDRQDHQRVGQHRRNGLRQRQAVPTTTAKKVPPVVRPTVTPRPTAATIVRPPVTTRSTVVRPTVTPVKPTVTPTLTPVVPPPSVVLPPTLITPVTSVVPVITSPVVSPPPPPPLTTSSVATTTERVLPSSIVPSTSTSTSAVAVAPSGSSSVSTGAVVGGIMGGFAALGIIAAALFLYLRKVREKKQGHNEAFNAGKFRNSAILLEDPAEKRGKPRPPTMIEQHVRNTPARSNPYPPSGAGHYGQEQPRYGLYNTPYNPGPYGPYPPPPAGAYGLDDPYRGHQGYPPHPQYPPQPHYSPQQYPYGHSTPTRAPRPVSSSSEQSSLVLPNPFASSPSSESEITGPTHYTTTSLSTVTTAAEPTASSSIAPVQVSSRKGEGEAPPAYEASSTFSGYRPDIKVKPTTLSVTNSTGGLSNSTPTTPNPSTIPTTAPFSASARAPASSATTGGPAPPVHPTTESSPIPVVYKASSSRPLSSHTVYDPNDAYGGM